METTFGIDASWSRLTIPTLRKFWADGMRVVTQNAWTGGSVPGGVDHIRANLRDSITVGYIPSAYIVVFNGGRYHVDRGREALGDLWDKLSFVVIDVEPSITGPSRPDLGSVVEALEYVRELGQRVIFYSYPDFWTNVMGNPRLPDWVECWRSHTGREPSLTEKYGYPWRWDQFVGHQYNNDVGVHGAYVDYSLWDMGWIMEERVKKLEDQVGYMSALIRVLIERQQAAGKALKGG